MSDSQTPKPQITKEQLQQLMAMQQAAGNAPKLTKKQMIVQKSLNSIAQNSQTLIHKLDRFINFITTKHDRDRNDVLQSARSPILFGVYVILIFIVFGGLWSAIAPLNSAVVAVGMLVPSTNKKTIQHQEGGIIKQIFVKQGDHVKEGDKLIELEDTKIKAEYENILGQYRYLLAQEVRLIAERDHAEKIDFPLFLQESSNIPEVHKLMQTQENIFRYRQDVHRAEKESLKQKILQLHKQIEGLQARKVAVEKNLAIMVDRLKSMKGLFTKGFATKSSMLEVEGREASFRSDLANAETEIAKTQQEITRTEIENVNYENKHITEVLRELKEIQVNVNSSREKFISLTDSMSRIVVKSPVDGIVNTLHVHTVGGVVGHGGALMEISPTNDTLVIEAKVPHKNIDVVHVGLIAKIRFSAFKSRITPSFTGKVISLSPDVVQDPRGQQPAAEATYIARVEIDMDEFNKIAKAKKLELHPGMQVEVQIVTGTRTLLRYLLDPVTDTMFRAFREK